MNYWFKKTLIIFMILLIAPFLIWGGIHMGNYVYNSFTVNYVFPAKVNQHVNQYDVKLLKKHNVSKLFAYPMKPETNEKGIIVVKLCQNNNTKQNNQCSYKTIKQTSEYYSWTQQFNNNFYIKIKQHNNQYKTALAQFMLKIKQTNWNKLIDFIINKTIS